MQLPFSRRYHIFLGRGKVGGGGAEGLVVGLEGKKRLLNLTVVLSEGILHVCFGGFIFYLN